MGLGKRGKEGRFGEETPARMDRRAARLFGGLNDTDWIEVALARSRGAEHDLLESARIRRVFIGRRDAEDGLDPHTDARSCDARGDFTAVGDEDAMKGPRLAHCGAFTKSRPESHLVPASGSKIVTRWTRIYRRWLGLAAGCEAHRPPQNDEAEKKKEERNQSM